jgi:hypothetical protein
MDASPARAYVYHNTVVGGREFLYISPQAIKRATFSPNWYFLNNLSLNNKGFCQAPKKLLPDFTASHNISSGSHRPWPSNNNNKDTGSRYQIKIVTIQVSELKKKQKKTCTMEIIVLSLICEGRTT